MSAPIPWKAVVPAALVERLGGLGAPGLAAGLPDLLNNPTASGDAWLQRCGAPWERLAVEVWHKLKVPPLRPSTTHLGPDILQRVRRYLGAFCGDSSVALAGCPWVPVGTVGPLLVLGHWLPHSPDLLGLPEAATIRVCLPPDAWKALLEAVRDGLSAVPPDIEDPKIVTEPPRAAAGAGAAAALEWMRACLPVPASEESALSNALAAVAADPDALPAGYRFAAEHILRGAPCVPVEHAAAEEEPLALLPPGFWQRHNALPLLRGDSTLFVASSAPADTELEDGLIARLPWAKRVIVVGADAMGISRALDRQAAGHIHREEAEEEHGQLAEASVTLDPGQVERISPKDAGISPQDLIQWVLLRCLRLRASDLHIEFFRGSVRFRARIDGELVVVHSAPGEMHEALVTVVKNWCNMGISRHEAQDGRFSIGMPGRVIDARVGALPSRHRAQKITIRFLDKSAGVSSLAELHLSPEHLHILAGAAAAPQGLIIVTGPTGSGKSTTLYAMLKEANRTGINIQTIEDPIEYEIDGINQTQVNPAVDLTFAEILKRVLRHDPDVVMVGEIRDIETANTAIDASLTGHLVLSTVHSMDAIRAVGRLLSLGVQSFHLADSLLLVQAQRLVRRLCACRGSAKPSDTHRRLFARHGFAQDEIPDLLAVKQGCRECDGTGFRGRLAVMEMCRVNDTIRDLIDGRAPYSKLSAAAAEHGYRPMMHNALQRVAAGLTTVSEAMGVATSLADLGFHHEHD